MKSCIFGLRPRWTGAYRHGSGSHLGTSGAFRELEAQESIGHDEHRTWNGREIGKTAQHGNGADSHLRCVRGGAAHLLQDVCSSSPRWVGGESVTTAAISSICRRICIGVAHRGRHASGLEHLWTTRPCGFRASRSAPPWVMVSRGPRASGLEHLRITRPSGSGPPALHRLALWSVAGGTRAGSNTSGLLGRAGSGPPCSARSWVMVTCGRRASGLEHLWTTPPSGSTARCERRASGFGQRWTTRPSGFAPRGRFLEHVG